MRGLYDNDVSEKFTPRSRSFREIFVNFSTFSDIFEHIWTCSDAFGHIRMHSDAFRCAGMRLDTFGNFRIFSIFSNDFAEFTCRVLTFIRILRLGSLLFCALTIRSLHYQLHCRHHRMWESTVPWHFKNLQNRPR